ncbi:MAG: LPXTG cell wall anchor domain-containing protein [Oscillospiraceae bacterium]|jgi:LPXTG-motif cell wall-anchored protein|nr:LPXTG cell wall anchor domain-containing protein [Oscillospiraceae bacterium]
MTPKTIIAIILVGVIIAGFIFLQVRKKKSDR